MLWVIYHFIESDDPSHSQGEHGVRILSFTQWQISEETWACKDEKATGAESK